MLDTAGTPLDPSPLVPEMSRNLPENTINEIPCDSDVASTTWDAIILRKEFKTIAYFIAFATVPRLTKADGHTHLTISLAGENICV